MFLPFASLLKRRLVMPFFILFLLSGCANQSPSAQHPQELSVPTPCGSAISTPPSSPPSLGKSVAFDLGGCIHVQSARGFTCSFSNYSSFTPGTLVLPTVEPTYDQGTLQSLRNYITAASQYGPGTLISTVPYPAFSANPDAFQLSAVTITAKQCYEIVHITNIGNAPVQISQVSVQLTADTQTNDESYNLIDVCSLFSLSASKCPGQIGAGEDIYDVTFDLHPGKTKTKIPVRCWERNGTCLPQGLLLNPGDVVEVYLKYSASSNLSFSLEPSFTLGSVGAGKQTTYPAPQLQAMFAFTSVSHFSCYALQGQQIIKVPLALPHWCI